MVIVLTDVQRNPHDRTVIFRAYDSETDEHLGIRLEAEDVWKAVHKYAEEHTPPPVVLERVPPRCDHDTPIGPGPDNYGEDKLPQKTELTDEEAEELDKAIFAEHDFVDGDNGAVCGQCGVLKTIILAGPILNCVPKEPPNCGGG